MKRNCLFLTVCLVLTLSASGCRTAGQGYQGMPYNQGYSQPQLGVQAQPQFFGGAPGNGQTSQGFGQLGRNLGNRFTNGLINRGVNSLINAAF